MNPVVRSEIVALDTSERSGRFWDALLEIGTRPGIRKEVWWCLGNFIEEASREFKSKVLEHVVESGWAACLGSVKDAVRVHEEFPNKVRGRGEELRGLN